MTLIYLASPYSHPDYAVRMTRFVQVCALAARLIRQGYLVFSPIAHTHPIAINGDLPLGFDYWEQFDTRLIGVCDEVWVYKLPGWEQSVGIQAEISIAAELGKPVSYVDA